MKNMHDHEHGSLFSEFWAVFTDPAHALAEIASTLVFDFLFIAFLWGIVFKRYLLPRLTHKIHADIDKQHGVNHDGSSKTN
jgi:hypothetical protein